MNSPYKIAASADTSDGDVVCILSGSKCLRYCYPFVDDDIKHFELWNTCFNDSALTSATVHSSEDAETVWDYASDRRICKAFAALRLTLKPVVTFTKNTTIFEDTTIADGDTWTINEGVRVKIAPGVMLMIEEFATINNFGIINIDEFDTMDSNNAVDNMVTINNFGTFINEEKTVFNNIGAINNFGTFINEESTVFNNVGTLINDGGTLRNNSSSIFTNEGTIETSRLFRNDGSILDNFGTITNSDVFGNRNFGRINNLRYHPAINRSCPRYYRRNHRPLGVLLLSTPDRKWLIIMDLNPKISCNPFNFFAQR